MALLVVAEEYGNFIGLLHRLLRWLRFVFSFQLLLYSYDMVFLTFQGSLLLHGRCDAVGLSRRADVAAGREEKQPKRRQLFRERFGNTKNCQELTQDLF